jgi:chemotaxis protein CheX
MAPTQHATQMLRLPDILDITRAAPLAECFRSFRGAKLVVDAAHVQRVGALCAQVIMSAVATWKADEVALCLTEPSAELRETFSLLGIGFAEVSTEEAAS